MEKYILKSSRLPLFLFCLGPFFILLIISLQTFIQWNDTSGLYICLVVFFIILFLTYLYKPKTLLIASDDGLFFPKNQCSISWNDIQKISVSDPPAYSYSRTTNFLDTFIIINLKNQKSKNDVVVINLLCIKQSTKEIEQKLNEFLIESRK